MTEPTTDAAVTEPQEGEEPANAETNDNQQAHVEEPQEGNDDNAWDPNRAKEKIRRINSENKALRERATEAEKQAANVPELEQQTTALGLENLRLRVGYELGLPLNLAARLQGATRDEMVADAETLVELVAPAQKAAPGGSRPVAALKPGATAEPIDAAQDDSYPSHWLPQRHQ